MSAYASKTRLIDAVILTEDNKAEVAAKYGYTLDDNGRVKNSDGVIINIGMWVCRFDDGTTNAFTDKLFSKLFDKVEPPKYKLSDIPDFEGDIKRAVWTDMYLRNDGYCFVLCDSDGPVQPYTFTAEDLTADDWMIKE